MVSKDLQNALEQNRTNIKRLLDALDADYEYPEEPEKQARMSAAFHPEGADAAKDVDVTAEDRVAWLFEENAKALEAAVQAAGGDGAENAATESEGMQRIKDALGGW